MCGYQVENLKSNARHGGHRVTHRADDWDVAALMLTNPNTLGVFEEEIHKSGMMHRQRRHAVHGWREHERAGGKARPGDFGVDVMHLNLHKIFSRRTVVAGPGSGPVAVMEHAGGIVLRTARQF